MGTEIAIFEDFKIRRQFDEKNQQWYFSVVVILQVLLQQSGVNEKLIEIEKKYAESLTIGVMNFPKIVKGTLIAQNYEIEKLKLENAKLRNLKKDEIIKIEEKYNKEKKELLEYWNKLRLSD